ncbi:MAG: 2-C-methyl-D-erythritol 4-phosphate cytidylyltransferase [Lachnospiraceae bacterium]|nr:2-C-methyl-D-erythritol 4-phosphate cytidylyltransferase [Lachnospiraceae bacterium]
MKTTAIVLAAGQGKRMESKVAKQYLLLKGKPVLYYTLKAFEDSLIDSIILVTKEGEEEYCRKEIIEAYGFQKVAAIVPGGRERYHSVFQGLKAVSQYMPECDYVFIHDGARPFVTNEMIVRVYEEVKRFKACVAGMPVKDTIKIADADGYADTTPERSRVWAVQTPQAFSFSFIMKAYEQLIEKEDDLRKKGIVITDDAMVAETFTREKVKLVEGSYRNIKITTPEDLRIAEAFL